MRVAIEKECAQILNEMLLDVLGPFLQDMKSVLNRTATLSSILLQVNLILSVLFTLKILLMCISSIVSLLFTS